MNATPETIKEWLSEIREDRHWLADQIGVSKRTLDNWFSDGFPLYAVKSIFRLKTEIESKLPEIEDASIQLSISQWKELSRRSTECGFTDELEFINSVIRESLSKNENELPHAPPVPKTATVPEPSHSTPNNVHWLYLCGGIAAGSQIPNDAPRESIPCPKSYDPDCYALRVFGTSMEPKIPDGSIIVVRRLPEGTFPKQGSAVVYADGYGLSLKRLVYRKATEGEEHVNAFGKVPVLKSDNKQFPEAATIDGGKIEAVFVETMPES